MCGLAGILGPGTADGALIAGMASALAHRGPDAEGVWVDRDAGIALVHRRLSILDLSPAGAQPMISADGRWVLAFNGEIYDHLTLRLRLEAEAPRLWRGHSDTEVLLEAIASWGVEATLEACNGMFALAAWDRRDGVLVLARDRIGEKPLYVGPVGRDMVFASELKAFRRHPAWRHGVDRHALGWLLELGYVPAPWSIHPGIFKLPAGSLLRLHSRDAGWNPDAMGFNARVERWWRLGEAIACARANPWSEGEPAALEAVRQLLDDAVQLRMTADVPVGALLSGGIDSTLVVASMARQSLRQVHTFTVGFEDPKYDESDVAASIARHIGTEHTHLVLRDDAALELVDRLPDIYDEPFADAAQIPALLVTQAVKRMVSVVLTGDGGDEVFHGYQRYLDAERVWSTIGGWPQAARISLAGLCRGTAQVMPSGTWSRKLARQGLRIGARDAGDYGRALMRFDGANATNGEADPAWSPVPASLDAATFGEYLRWRDQDLALPEGINTKLDRASMAVGLELRAPMLDPRLLALAWRFPPDWHTRGAFGKRMLRQLAHGLVPPGIETRPKQGFDVPVATWLRGPLRAWADRLLAANSLADDPFLDAKQILARWHAHLSGRADYGYALWAVLMYRAWMRRHG